MTVLSLHTFFTNKKCRRSRALKCFTISPDAGSKCPLLICVLLENPKLHGGSTFGPKDKCFNEAFETRGMYLMDNYLNMEKLNSEFQYTNQANMDIKTKMTITSSKPTYTMINHAVTMDSLFLGFFVLFALTKTFNPIGSLLYYTFADPMQEIPIQIDYTSAEKSAQSAMLESLIHD